MADNWRALTDNEKLVAMMAATIATGPGITGNNRAKVCVERAEEILDVILSDKGRDRIIKKD